ncbi:MAG: DNA repair protein RadC [Dysgonamonadaceae bacterium]|jgi:DNA repair protein RadC|nr:DNA repair protein RadC [Dysgonamonadaceae bacterium]
MNTITKLSVKNWSPADQPREKLLAKGTNALSDAELLAIIIGSGNIEENSVELSQRILHAAENNISQLGKFSVNDLVSSFKGIGNAKAVSIVAALELGRRRRAEDMESRKKIRFSIDIYNYFYPMLCDLPHEEFWALFLNNSNRIIDRFKISQGGISKTGVDGRLIYKEALTRLASYVILCHNHPSGNPKPSYQDDETTFRLKKGLQLLELSLLDHLIFCEGTYYSYADEERI